MNFLKEEPAKVVAAVTALFVLLAASGIDLPAEATEATAVAIPVVMAAILAALTRPVKVPLVVGGVTAVLTLAAAWGLNLPGTDDMAFVNGLAAFLTAGGALLIRGQVSPNAVTGVVDNFSVASGNGAAHTPFQPE